MPPPANQRAPSTSQSPLSAVRGVGWPYPQSTTIAPLRPPAPVPVTPHAVAASFPARSRAWLAWPRARPRAPTSPAFLAVLLPDLALAASASRSSGAVVGPPPLHAAVQLGAARPCERADLAQETQQVTCLPTVRRSPLALDWASTQPTWSQADAATSFLWTTSAAAPRDLHPFARKRLAPPPNLLLQRAVLLSPPPSGDVLCRGHQSHVLVMVVESAPNLSFSVKRLLLLQLRPELCAVSGADLVVFLRSSLSLLHKLQSTRAPAPF
mmetsp:Transcript_44937/g.105934  ORF Transcript_44937/g.105934 Transcript_44937/m.105934 type:complete len:268 (+) Transcript_44937:62-865(+)